MSGKSMPSLELFPDGVLFQISADHAGLSFDGTKDAILRH